MAALAFASRAAEAMITPDDHERISKNRSCTIAGNRVPFTTMCANPPEDMTAGCAIASKIGKKYRFCLLMGVITT